MTTGTLTTDTNTTATSDRPSRTAKVAFIREFVQRHWRTLSDRQIAGRIGATPTTVGKYRRELEEQGYILPRFKNGQGALPCLRELSIFAVEPAPENDKLYDPVRTDDPDFQALVENIREHGVINPPKSSADGFIYDGNRRLAALRCLGMDRITVEIHPEVSHSKDPDGFLRLLRWCNLQRVKTTAEVMRESIVDMEPDTWHRVCDYRKSVSEVDGAEVYHLIGEKTRSEIVQKRGLADAIVRVTIARFERYGPTSDRKINYLLLNETGLVRNDVTQEPFLNNDDCYQDVTDLLTRLRLDGSIPFEAIEDETRPVIIWNTHRSVQSFIKEQTQDFLCNYWRDLMQSQPNWIELLVEKNTVARDLEKIAAKYTIPMTSGRGYASLPPRKAMVDRFHASGKEKLIIVAATDMDPEGQDIPNAFGLSLRDDFGLSPDQLVIVKAVLTHKQTQELQLHEGQFAKTKGRRYKRFVEAYGNRCWELEAVDTEFLQQATDNTIQRVIDPQAFYREVEIEKKEKGELNQRRWRVMELLATAYGSQSR